MVVAGRRCPNGFLPVFSVADEQEAEELLTLACETNVHGEYMARELMYGQALENLYAFGDRLRKAHDEVIVPHGRCRCAKKEAAA